MNKLIIVLSVVCFIFITACKKDNSSTNFNDNLNTGRCRMWCDISGNISMNFKSDDGYSFSAYNTVSMVLEPEIWNAATGNKEHISLLFPVNTTPGTYNLSAAGAPNISFSFTKENLYAGESKTWNATVGSNMTFVLTKSSYTELEGTFSGTAVSDADGSTVTITNGKFKTVFTH